MGSRFHPGVHGRKRIFVVGWVFDDLVFSLMHSSRFLLETSLNRKPKDPYLALLHRTHVFACLWGCLRCPRCTFPQFCTGSCIYICRLICTVSGMWCIDLKQIQYCSTFIRIPLVASLKQLRTRQPLECVAIHGRISLWTCGLGKAPHLNVGTIKDEGGITASQASHWLMCFCFQS